MAETAVQKTKASSRRRRHVVRRVLQLVGLALLSDVAIIAAELIAGMDPIADFEQRPVLYLYMLLGTIVAFGVFGAVLGSREALLEERAIRDPLTGLFNSGYFHARLRQALASAQRLRTPLALVLFDADHFKRINDVHGHPVGDQVLRAIGATLEAQLRTGEIGARVGGEEFALLLPGTSAETAAAAAERIRRAIQQQVAVPGRVEPRTVTVSAGVACVAPGQTSPPAEIYQRADQALYQAKRAGRDRVVIAAAGDPASGGAD
jgi:diguanylate cyclase (GGDEF)-like protein